MSRGSWCKCHKNDRNGCADKSKPPAWTPAFTLLQTTTHSKPEQCKITIDVTSCCTSSAKWLLVLAAILFACLCRANSKISKNESCLYQCHPFCMLTAHLSAISNHIRIVFAAGNAFFLSSSVQSLTLGKNFHSDSLCLPMQQNNVQMLSDSE